MTTTFPDTAIAAAADRAVRDIVALVPGWDGPIPTNDNLHDVCDPNAYVANAAKNVLGLDLADDPDLTTLNAVFERVLADPRVDTDAPEATVEAFADAAWGR